MCEQTWLIERIDGPDERPFLHWVGEESAPMQARMVTEWPPTEEDLDYGQERVGHAPVVVEIANVAELLAKEGVAPIDLRPFDEAEQARLAAWRPFALVDRLLEGSEHVTIHGARCETVVPLDAWAHLAGTFPRMAVVEGPLAFLMVVRDDDDRWRLDVGDPPRNGQSLRAWLAGLHVRFTCARQEPGRHAGWTLSGIRSVRAAEQLVVALYALQATRGLSADLAGAVSLDCLTGTSVEIRVLPSAAAVDRAAFTRLLGVR